MKFSIGSLFKAVASISPLGMMYNAQRSARKEQKNQENMMWQQQQRADAMAKKQRADRDAVQRRISLGNVRSRRSRVRGGLFGDLAEGGQAGTLGG